MKNQNHFITFSLILFGVLILLFNSCKKDKIDPIITWENPADISFNTSLSEIQLNATSNVDGYFTYTPTLGTKLKAGYNQILQVEFIPSDAKSYHTIAKSVKINVLYTGITFNPNLTYGSVTDIDGNVYKTIAIGTQTWMAENLRTTKYQNEDPIENVADNSSWVKLKTGAYCNYNNTNNMDSIEVFGRLYNWYAAKDPRGIAPQGWHVPSDTEWSILQNYLQKNIPNHTMKEASLTHWSTINDDDNASGFTAFPCGMRYADNGTFSSNDIEIYWLSSTGAGTTTSFLSWVYNGSDLIPAGPTAGGAGWSLRCVKDN